LIIIIILFNGRLLFPLYRSKYSAHQSVLKLHTEGVVGGRTTNTMKEQYFLNKAVNYSLVASNKAPQLQEFHEPAQLRQYSNSLWVALPRAQILVGVRYSAFILTGSGVHPASYTMGTGSFPSVKWPGCGVDTPSPSNTLVIERVEV